MTTRSSYFVKNPLRIAILGASGYTGAELVRLITRHPFMKITALTADRKAGQKMSDVFPHLSMLDLPPLQTMDEVDWNHVDGVFAALPHGITQTLLGKLPSSVKIVDLSADLRLETNEAYKTWYGHDHQALDLQKEVVYGLPEFYRSHIKKARIVANTGCYVASSLLPLLPLVKKKLIKTDTIIIDAKSGVSGAGRSAKEANLFTEVSEGFHAYGVGHHRHMGEIDQELTKAAGHQVTPTFTPHLLPQNRGILSTIYVTCNKGKTVSMLHDTLVKQYEKEPFVQVLPMGQVPHTRHVRGSNYSMIGICQDRQEGRAIIVSVLDNLVRGASGQAIQNMNLMFHLEETTGLLQAPLFP
jgi:N-acetyl-gamma-glutamyl-phosphate reductase